MIPPMLLQPYIENAIIHGFGAKSIQGKLSVYFGENKGRTTVVIDDDGIGREAGKITKIVKDGTKSISMGMKLISRRVELLNDMLENVFEIKIEDKRNEEGLPSGTKIEISFNAIREEEL